MAGPRYAVFGQPISHSLSPRIHAMFGAQLGIGVDYRAIEAGRDEFSVKLDAFARDGGVGANVTLPLKQDAFALCAEVSDRARRCGSVNTLIRAGDSWRGDSTDGSGFLRDVATRHAFDPRGHACLLLGAGGAARAVAFALVDAGAHLAIVNRTHERARELAASVGAGARALTSSELDGAAFDLVVHATAAGHATATFEWPSSFIRSDTLCYDLSYGDAAAAFLRWSRAAGATRASEGLGMLVEQAADSFTIWHALRPDTAPVLAALRGDTPPSLAGA
ncbi:MAG TPA: shikimate dehydrogenase [Rhodanobacteraceae bacterium]|nr:shikimate dehydrogenase [Rhodanobacteraceae bacterium]